MYTHFWNKYLPVIKILLKRSVNQNDQTLDMNRIDFERAGSGRKAGYKFYIDFINGRIDNVLSSSPLAHDLAQLMMQDEALREIISKNDFQLVFNTKFQLTIKCKTVENNTSAS